MKREILIALLLLTALVANGLVTTIIVKANKPECINMEELSIMLGVEDEGEEEYELFPVPADMNMVDNI
jgi:hypothetical protein